VFALPFTSLWDRILYVSLYISAPGFEDVMHLPAISDPLCKKIQEKKNCGEAKIEELYLINSYLWKLDTEETVDFTLTIFRRHREDGGRKFIRNFGNVPDHTVSLGRI
jgi:hypothetical protein